MSNSSLVNYKLLTSHFGYPTGEKGRDGKKIDKIFVHHMAGNLTVEQCGKVFKNNEASAHYGIDGKGRVGQYVLESNTAWHCANKKYNQRSIGIELANDGGAKSNWHVSDKTIAKCIDLIVDICERNGIEKINYTGDLDGNLCMHCWTASTACPGGYLKTKFKYIAKQVNKKLNNSTKAELYRVRKSWDNADSQVGAFKELDNAKKIADEKGLNVYDSNGKLVYEGKKKEKTTADKIIEACKTQAEYMKNFTYGWESKPTIKKSKKKGTCVTYVACVLQRVDLVKSGKYIWHDGKGYGNGKVYGDTSKFKVMYQDNKTFKQLRDVLKKGDVVLCDDNKSGKEGSGGHVMIFSGKWTASGNPRVYDQNSATYAKKGKKSLLRTYSKSHKILAICRAK